MCITFQRQTFQVLFVLHWIMCGEMIYSDKVSTWLNSYMSRSYSIRDWIVFQILGLECRIIGGGALGLIAGFLYSQRQHQKGAVAKVSVTLLSTAVGTLALTRWSLIKTGPCQLHNGFLQTLVWAKKCWRYPYLPTENLLFLILIAL